jgi:hypothetical protein
MRAATKQELLDFSAYVCGRVRGRVAGLTDDEYLWEPAADMWSIRPDATGTWWPDRSVFPPEPAPLTTIAWRLAHVTDILSQERNGSWLGLVVVSPDDLSAAATADDAVARLERANEIWNGYLQQVDEDTLGDAIGPIGGRYADATRCAFVLHELDEVIHHGAEIALMRDVYRATHEPRTEPPLVAALLRGDRAAVEQDAGDDANAIASVRAAEPDLVARAAATGRWDAVQLLVEQGFDVNAGSRRTALHEAAGTGRLDAVQFLVEHGADLDAADADFRATPLGWAQYFHHADVIAYLEGR